MIYEYAIDPAFLLELTDKNDLSRELCRTLRLGSICITAGYPDDLGEKAFALIKQQLMSASDPKYKAKLQERASRVTQLAAELTLTQTKRFDAAPWGQGFANEHRRHPFQGILTMVPAAGAEPHRNLEWIRTHACDLFTYKSSHFVRRNAQAVNQVIAPLLQNASDITFIDPYFFPADRFRRPYQLHFLSIAVSNHVRTSGMRTVRIICAAYTGENSTAAATQFKQSCENDLPSWMPNNMTLQIHRIKKRKSGQEIHNRYILTDIGGVLFGHGTDDSQNYSYDNICLLSAQDVAHWKAVYTQGSANFDWSEPPVTISKS